MHETGHLFNQETNPSPIKLTSTKEGFIIKTEQGLDLSSDLDKLRHQIISQLEKEGVSIEFIRNGEKESLTYTLRPHPEQESVFLFDAVNDAGQQILTIPLSVDTTHNNLWIMFPGKRYGSENMMRNTEEELESERLKSQYSGKGIMGAAQSLLIEYAYEKGYEAVKGLVDVENVESLNSRKKAKKIFGPGTYEDDTEVLPHMGRDKVLITHIRGKEKQIS